MTAKSGMVWSPMATMLTEWWSLHHAVFCSATFPKLQTGTLLLVPHGLWASHAGTESMAVTKHKASGPLDSPIPGIVLYKGALLTTPMFHCSLGDPIHHHGQCAVAH